MAKSRSEAEVVFKATDDGLKSTLKDITAEMTKNNAEAKLVQAQMKLTGSETDKLSSNLSSLEKSYDLQSQKIQVTAERLENAKKYYGENSTEVQRLERELIKQQTAQQNLANKITETSEALGKSKGEIQDYSSTMKSLDDEQKNIQASASLVESEYKKWQSTVGKTASESEKFAKAQEYVAKQSSLAEQKISVLARQLDATQQEFGATSTEAMQMQAKLNDAESEFEQLGQAAKSVDTSELDDIGSKIDLSNLMQASDILADIGDKMMELGQSAMESADNVGSSQGKIQASFGLTKEEAEKLTNVAKNIYHDGFGDSLDQVTDALVIVKRQMGDLNDSDLQNITEQAMVLEETMGADMGETLRGAKNLMNVFGMSGQEAMDLIVVGTQNGLDSTGELGDNLAEYAGLFDESGYNATEMFNILQAGLDGGMYNLDKVNDLVKEFGIRVADGSIEQGVTNIGGSFKTLFDDWKKGGGTQKELFQSISEELMNVQDEQKKATIVSEIFGSLGEDAGYKVIEAMGDVALSGSGVKTMYDDVAGAAQKMNDDSTTPMQDLKGKFAELQDSMAPIGETIIDALEPVIDFLVDLSENFSELSPGMQKVIVVVGGIAAAFTMLAPFISSVISIFTTLGGLFTGGGLLTGIGTFLTGTIGPAIAGLIGVIAPFIPIIAAVVAAVIGAIAIFKNWGAISDWLSEKWGMFKDWISEIWTSISEKTSEVWNGIKETLMGVWQGIVEAVTPVFETIKNVITVIFMTIQSVISGIWTVITSLLQAAWNTIVAIAQAVWQPFAEFFSGIWNGIKDTALLVWETISTFLSTIWANISAFAQSVWNPIASFFSGIWTGMKNAAQTAWNAISSFLSGIWNTISSAASSVWNAISGMLSGVWNSIKGKAQSIFNSLAQVIANIWNSISSTASNVWNGIKSTASNIWNGIKSTISNVVNGIKNTVSNVFDSLKNTVSNIFGGIKSAMTGPIETAKNTISGIIDKIKGFFSGLNLSFPKIKMPSLPHFSIQGKFSLNPPSVPHLGVDWYAKGGVFNGPSVIGVGEAGTEAVLPLKDNVLGTIGQMISENMPTTSNDSGSQIINNQYRLEVKGNIENEQTARRVVEEFMDQITELQRGKNTAFN